jgi:flagellar M-ring protein FliF
MEFLKNLNLKQIIGLAIGGISLFIGIIFLIIKMSNPNMAIMYGALSSEDANAVMSKLQAMGVSYNVRAEDNQIEVPADKVLALRMTLAQEGLPSSGRVAGYEIFDKSDTFGTSQFVYNINMVRALEGELSRTIASLSPILSARVHLVIPKKELLSKSVSTPSASVVIKMKGAQQLNKAEVAAVAHLVAAAVPDLKLDNITIVDDKGTPLKLGAESSEYMPGGLIDSSLEYKTNMENRLNKIIEDLLSKYVGTGKVKANVFANIDFDREVINYEAYDPEEQVVRSQRTISELDKDSSHLKDVSLANNIPNGSRGQTDFSGKERNKSDVITNYEISKKVGNRISEQGRIKNLSIAVLIDGTYIKDANGSLVYNERSEDEMTKLRSLVASAVGFDSDRGDKLELINLKMINEMPDSEESEEFLQGLLHGDLKSLIQTVIAGIILIILIVMISKMLIFKKRGDQQFDILQQDAVMQGAVGEVAINNDLGKEFSEGGSEGSNEQREIDKRLEFIEADGAKYANLSKYLNETVDAHLDESVAVVKGWLYR